MAASIASWVEFVLLRRRFNHRVGLTGMRRNLNAMFAARGDVDPATYATDWTGTLVFLGALVVIAAAWFAARPLVVAPAARLTGTVSQR